jgi:hypothetical protein
MKLSTQNTIKYDVFTYRTKYYTKYTKLISHTKTLYSAFGKLLCT